MSNETVPATATALVSSVSIREDNPVVAVARGCQWLCLTFSLAKGIKNDTRPASDRGLKASWRRRLAR
jgi:hypothetical protein